MTINWISREMECSTQNTFHGEHRYFLEQQYSMLLKKCEMSNLLGSASVLAPERNEKSHM